MTNVDVTGAELVNETATTMRDLIFIRIERGRDGSSDRGQADDGRYQLVMKNLMEVDEFFWGG